MITLLGVGHVFDLARAVRNEILARRPRVVALELDPIRFQALLERRARRASVSLFSVLAHFQARIAQEYGVRVGDEMVAAARAAQEIGSEIALIDEESRRAILRAWQQMTFEERVRLAASVFASAFVRRKKVEEELARYHEDERALIEEFGNKLPTVKRVLIDERDERMAGALRELHRTKGDVVAVVGDGHIDGLVRRLASEPVVAVRLKDLRTRPESTASTTVTYRL